MHSGTLLLYYNRIFCLYYDLLASRIELDLIELSRLEICECNLTDATVGKHGASDLWHAPTSKRDNFSTPGCTRVHSCKIIILSILYNLAFARPQLSLIWLSYRGLKSIYPTRFFRFSANKFFRPSSAARPFENQNKQSGIFLFSPHALNIFSPNSTHLFGEIYPFYNS
jgi:hypothetical protein